MLKTVVIVNDAAYVSGGAGKVAIDSAIALSQQALRVILFSSRGPVDERLERSRVEVVCLQQKHILEDTNRIRAAVQGIWNHKAYQCFKTLLQGLDRDSTVVHFHGWTKGLSPALFKVTADLDMKVAITLHDYFLFCPNGGLYDYQKQKICRLAGFSWKCAFCHCDSRSYAQKMYRNFRQLVQSYYLRKNKQVAILYISQLCKKLAVPFCSSFPHRDYDLTNPVELNMQKIVQVATNDLYLCISRLSPEKGVELFCRAMTELGLKGCVIGDGNADVLEKLAKSYPSVHFTGWLVGDEKEYWIKQGKALVLPSLWYETFGLVVAEMKSYGIPCIVPDRCAASEQVEDGKTGYLFDIGSLDSLKNSIIKYESADRQALQQNITESFHPIRYAMDTHLRNLLAIYNDITNSSDL